MEHGNSACCHEKKRVDYLLWASLAIVIIGYFFGWLLGNNSSDIWYISFINAVFNIVNQMWWGVLLGIIMLALLSKVPREFIASIIGQGGSVRGILRATAAGILLDLCSHGILMIGAKLYQKGASIGQVMAFLIASPWNSFSLTLILIAMIGLPWTLLFIVLSAMIAIITGIIFENLVSAGYLPNNPNKSEIGKEFNFWQEARLGILSTKYNIYFFLTMFKEGIIESRMVMRWLLFGIILAALVRTFVDMEIFQSYFGPSLMGLGITIIAATIMEVCSEGASPIAADLLTRANAPGNSFAFLMTGVSTDYTEVMVLKDVTKSWKIALFLPLLTVPQVMLVGFLINISSF